MNITQVDIGWIAGIIDGEGTITLERNGKWRYPSMCMSSTDKELVDAVKQFLGGLVRSVKLHGKMIKPQWHWHSTGGIKIIKTLKIISPYLRCPKKKARAEFIIQKYPATVTKNGYYSPIQTENKINFENAFFNL